MLPAGSATCAHCGGMRQRTGTSVTGHVYVYYTCANRAQKGPAACRSNAVPMAYLDDLVIRGLERELFNPERLAELLSALITRGEQGARGFLPCRQKWTRRPNGSPAALRPPQRRIAALKASRERAPAALDRARANPRPAWRLRRKRSQRSQSSCVRPWREGRSGARKAYRRALLGSVEVGKDRVKVTASRDILSAAANAAQPGEIVQFSAPKWRRACCDIDGYCNDWEISRVISTLWK